MKCLNNNIKVLYSIIICFLFIKFLSVLNIIPMLTNIYPIIWIIIAIIGIFITHQDYNHFFNNKDKIDTIVIMLLIYLMIYFSLGLIFGYSYNVYDNSKLYFILSNLYIYILPISFQEYIRGILCNYSNNSNKIKIVISILYILINLNFNSILNLNISGEMFLKFLCSNLIPLISLEFVLTYLCSVGSYKLSTIYKIIVTLFSIFIPILPNINFFLNGIITTSIPIIIYFIIDNTHQKELKKEYIREEKNSLFEYVPIFIVIIYGILNLTGILKYQTISILSNSMNPLYYKGDMVLIKKLNEEEKEQLQIGDIIAFYDENNNVVVHRIVKIIDSENLMFKTNGDNNSNDDFDILKKEDIKGKYLFHIKYIGYPTVFIYETLNG